MKKIISLIVILTLSLGCLYSQEVIKVWPNNAPSSNGLTDEAELFVYLPEKKDSLKTPAVLICPGGGYAGVSAVYEGHAFAKWLASQGVAGIVLKYRLPNEHKEIPFDDAEQAMLIIRSDSDKWNIDINRVGIAGFSAGGHLAAVFSNLDSNSDINIRPDFTILFYPVISFETATKGGTRSNLLGKTPSASDIYSFSADRLVTENTPPAIIFVSDNDLSVPSAHSIMYYNSLKENNVPAALYVFPEGEHGWGMIKSFKYYDESLSLLKMWLKRTVLTNHN
ncbi:acetyl esterase/lipase [Dysgonomonas alginatilytica]|uniref:Acetyl esterase/lipase n=1 Tax=Dysgonomonas alginatilytica TaxID=1605892 RepID=A0A2V3PNV5_9BACT|nr:alpha/beta hydrolase [Dysgonomonas alginatilytica]PXV62537.1 acetyl esterase/lipase [Dysgonomonas alginatilytica]